PQPTHAWSRSLVTVVSSHSACEVEHRFCPGLILPLVMNGMAGDPERIRTGDRKKRPMHRRPGPAAGAAEKYNPGGGGAVQHLDRSWLRGFPLPLVATAFPGLCVSERAG